MMLTHYHFCSECCVEWKCYDLDCVGVNEMFCDECSLERELAAEEPPSNQLEN